MVADRRADFSATHDTDIPQRARPLAPWSRLMICTCAQTATLGLAYKPDATRPVVAKSRRAANIRN
jgi:hypothetical protein